MQNSVKRLVEVYGVVEQIALVLQVLLYDDSTIENLFYCSTGLKPAYSSASSSSASALIQL